MSMVPAQAALRVISAGPGVTLQDAGRHGYLRYGVTAAGPMDPLAYATANLAAGNAAGSTAIEISLGGIELTTEAEPLAVALAGGDFAISLDARVLPSAAMVLTIEPGAVLNIRAGQSGAWCYLAVAGRLVVPQLLGSNATHADRLWRRRWPRDPHRRPSAGRVVPQLDAIPRCDRCALARSSARNHSRRARSAGRLFQRRADRGVSRRPLARLHQGRSHGLFSRRAAPDPRERLQHRLRRDRDGRDPGAGRRSSDRADGRSPIDRWLSEDRNRDRPRPRKAGAGAAGERLSGSRRCRLPKPWRRGAKRPPLWRATSSSNLWCGRNSHPNSCSASI